MNRFEHVFDNYYPLGREELAVRSRRNFLKTCVAGMAGLSFLYLLHARAKALLTPGNS